MVSPHVDTWEAAIAALESGVDKVLVARDATGATRPDDPYFRDKFTGWLVWLAIMEAAKDHPDIAEEINAEMRFLLAMARQFACYQWGDLLAAERTEIICAKLNRSVPSWVAKERLRRIEAVIKNGTSGRHGHITLPEAEAYDLIRRLNIFAAVEAVRRSRPEIVGDAWFELANKLLVRRAVRNVPPPLSTKGIYYDVRGGALDRYDFLIQKPQEHYLIYVYQRELKRYEQQLGKTPS